MKVRGHFATISCHHFRPELVKEVPEAHSRWADARTVAAEETGIGEVSRNEPRFIQLMQKILWIRAKITQHGAAYHALATADTVFGLLGEEGLTQGGGIEAKRGASLRRRGAALRRGSGR